MAKLQEYRSLGWCIVHRMGKPIILNSIGTIRLLKKAGVKVGTALKSGLVVNSLGYVRDLFGDTIKAKNATSWVNPESKILYDILTVVIEKDEILRGDKDDHIRQFYLNLRDIGCTLCDEDSHYMLRVLYLVELIHEFYPLFNIEMHRNRAYWHWDEIYAGLKKNVHGDKEAGYSPTYEALKKRLEAINNGRTVSACPDAVRIPSVHDVPDVPAGSGHDKQEHGSAEPNERRNIELPATEAKA